MPCLLAAAAAANIVCKVLLVITWATLVPLAAEGQECSHQRQCDVSTVGTHAIAVMCQCLYYHLLSKRGCVADPVDDRCANCQQRMQQHMYPENTSVHGVLELSNLWSAIHHCFVMRPASPTLRLRSWQAILTQLQGSSTRAGSSLAAYEQAHSPTARCMLVPLPTFPGGDGGVAQI